MIVAVTGNTGSGKSMVAALFVAWGARRIDADRLGRELWETDPGLRARIRDGLGPGVLGAGGEIDRGLLGRTVFGDWDKLRVFDSIIQPILREKIRESIRDARSEPDTVWVLDAALLFERGLESEVDRVILVTAAPETRVERIAGRHRIDRAEAAARVERQSPDGEKAARAHHVIVNQGSFEELEKRARTVWVSIHDRPPSA